MSCLNCGKDLIQTPGKRAKQFCDGNCRTRYWQKEKSAQKKAAKIPINPSKAIPLPPDYVAFTKIGILKNDGSISPIITITPESPNIPQFKNDVERMAYEEYQKLKLKNKIK